MKTKIIILIIMWFTLLTSCDTSNKNKINNKYSYEIVTIDSCEYILSIRDYDGHHALIHKGNCKNHNKQ